MKDKFIEVKCSNCCNNFNIRKRNYKRRLHENKPILCSICMKQYISDKARNQYYSLSDEEKAKQRQRLSNASRGWYASLTQEDKDKIHQKQRDDWKNKSEEEKARWSQQTRDQWANLSHDAKEAEIKRLTDMSRKYWDSTDSRQQMSIRAKERWNNLSNEEKESELNRLYIAHVNWVNSLTDDEKIQISEMCSRNAKLYWDSIAKEDIEIIMAPLRKGYKKWWDSRSDKEKEKIIATAIEGGNKWRLNMDPEEYSKWCNKWTSILADFWKNIPDDKRKSIRDKWSVSIRKSWDNKSITEYIALSNRASERWINLPDDVKREKIKRFRSYSIHRVSGLNKQFENDFVYNTKLSEFIFTSEYLISNDGMQHYWDYGIFNKQGDLIMVVDLDGEYFHAINSDYSGYSNVEIKDSERGLTVKSGIMICIIPSNNYQKAFDDMIICLINGYEYYCNRLLKEYTLQPFPEYHFDIRILYKSYHKLDIFKGNSYQLQFNHRLGDIIIHHFHTSIWRDHYKDSYSVFNIWKNKNTLKKLIKSNILYQTFSNNNKILQPFNVYRKALKMQVFSASLAKSIIQIYLNDFDTIFDPFSGYSARMLGAISLGKRYIGQDYSIAHVNESNKILELLNKFQFEYFVSVTCKDIYQSGGEYPCLFTCPPYQDEVYQDVPVSTNTCDDWIDECLKRFKCRRYVFVVDNTEKYKDHVVFTLLNKNSFKNIPEYIILLD